MNILRLVITFIMICINFVIIMMAIKDIIRETKEIRRLDGWVNYITGPHLWSDDIITYEDFVKRFDEDKEFRKLYSKKRRKHKK